MNKNVRLAIMQDVKFGLVDGHRVALHFSAYTEEHGAACHYLEGDEIITVIKDSKVEDIRELEMYPCFVESEDGTFGPGGIQRFVRVWKRKT